VPNTGRQGPRPLPLHLATAMVGWTGSLAALPLARSGSPIWKGGLRDEGAALARDLAAIPSDDLAAAVTAEIAGRSARLLSAVERYRGHPGGARQSPADVVWTEGSTRLLDLGPADGIPLLVVPSLINRWYILDLMPERSFLARLVARGVRPLVVDWGAPGEAERGFTLEDYIAGRLESALDVARRVAGSPVAVLGYCMGGLLATSLALRRQDEIPALAVVASPWDFHAVGPDEGRRAELSLAMLEPLIAAVGDLPVDAIQWLFHSQDPFQVIDKFLRFGGLPPDSSQADLFVAVEDWVNDGVPLAGAVARACLGGWYARNEPGRGEWHVAGRRVDPAAWRRPFLAVVPTRDRIVPPPSAAALADAVPGAERIETRGGHIGMIVGDAAPAVTTRIADWLHDAGRAFNCSGGAGRL